MARLHLLGVGTPTPTAARFGTSSVLELGPDRLMFDCGPAATHKLVKAGLFPTEIDWLFFTHHHSDHNADYPCFLLCRWDQSTGREKRLKVFGPPPTEWITARLIGPEGAFRDDLRARIEDPGSQSVHANRGGSLPRPGPDLDVADVGPGPVTGGEGWRVTAARADHAEPWLEALSYRVDAAVGSVVFAGDTGPCEELARLARGADVLVANCWDHQESMESSGEAPGQTGTLDAARMARDSGAAKLIITHYGPALAEPGSMARALADIAAVYDGETVFGEELTAVDLW